MPGTVATACPSARALGRIEAGRKRADHTTGMLLRHGRAKRRRPTVKSSGVGSSTRLVATASVVERVGSADQVGAEWPSTRRSNTGSIGLTTLQQPNSH